MSELLDVLFRVQSHVRWVVQKDYYTDNGDNCVCDFPILYGSESEANVMMNHLKSGSDISFFDPNDVDECAVLYVDKVYI
jgi:hypothetical protein